MSRTSHLSAAFRARPLTLGGRELRPLTAGSLDLLQSSGNALFADRPAGSPEPDEAEVMRGIFEFAWIHLADEDDVVFGWDDPDFIRREARKLSLSTPLEDVEEFALGFSEMRTRLQAAMVEIVPDKTGKKPARAKQRPTGSPSSSTPSAVRAIPSGKSTSSGSSPSSEPSNTCTPPSTTTTPAAAGKSRIWRQDEPAAIPEDAPIPLD